MKMYGFDINISLHTMVTSEHPFMTPWMAERMAENRLKFALETLSDILSLDGIEIKAIPTTCLEV